MTKVRSILGTVLVTLMALLSVATMAGQSASAAPVETAVAPATATAPAAPVARRTTSPCHGYVYDLSKDKSTNRVHMTYWVWCSKHVRRIQVRAFLREGDRWAYTRARVCTDTYVCSVRTSMRDHTGKQYYTVRAVEGGDLAEVTYVKNGPHLLWSCGGGATGWGDPMSCTGAGHTW